jgi:hypothetical protein
LVMGRVMRPNARLPMQRYVVEPAHLSEVR